MSGPPPVAIRWELEGKTRQEAGWTDLVCASLRASDEVSELDRDSHNGERVALLETTATGAAQPRVR